MEAQILEIQEQTENIIQNNDITKNDSIEGLKHNLESRL
jgi:hypothetical protein